jgi:hypothetical protein
LDFAKIVGNKKDATETMFLRKFKL